jgi:hypothetical protein
VSPKVKFITHTALFISLAIVLPVGLHMLGPWGRVLLPMHIPVLLAGFLVGPLSGLVVGLLAPVVSHLLTGMPPSYAVPLMTLELPVYGLIAGIAYRRFNLNIYFALLWSMIFGRLVFGAALFFLGMFIELPYTAAAFFSLGGALWAGLPGIVLQLVIVPIIITGVRRRRRP